MNNKKIGKRELFIASLVLSAVAVGSLFLPIIKVQPVSIWDFEVEFSSIAGYQLLFGSGNSIVDFISLNLAVSELRILAAMFVVIPMVLNIVAVVLKLIFNSKRSGNIVPVILDVIALVEVILAIIIASVVPAFGSIIFMAAMVLNIVVNIASLMQHDEKVENKSVEKKDDKPVKAAAEHALKGVSGVYAGAVVKLSTQPLWIGRDSSKCNIVLEGGKVSRQHCCIWLDENGKVMFKDTSTNGVYFPNGDRMLSNIDMELNEGETIFIGNSENSFQII